MSDSVVSSPAKDSATPSRRGQSLVEFALVLPMLIVLLVGVADFGRVFQAGIAMEAAARNAAEAAAQEYTQIVRNKGTLSSADYAHLHDLALKEVCREADVLPNQAVDGTGQCTMPVSAVCVHDVAGADTGCGSSPVSVPTYCSTIYGWSAIATAASAAPTNGASPPLPYVEVRTCYQFTTLLNLHMSLPFGAGISVGDIWLERGREFVVGDY